MPNPVLKSSPEAPLYMREFKRVHYLAENDTEHYTDIGNTMGRKFSNNSKKQFKKFEEAIDRSGKIDKSDP